MTKVQTKQLRVAHFPQLPCEPYTVFVDTPKEGKKIMDILADYDLFQYEHNIKPDYSNACELEEWDSEYNEWVTWYDEETGLDVHEYFEEEI